GRDQLSYQIAEVYAVRGEKDKAFEWLQIAFDQHDTGTLALLVDPLLRGLRDDPRYKSFLAKLGLPAPSLGENPSIFAELKRRNVYKVAVAYIVAGWALSQGIAQVFPVFDDSELVIRLLVLLIIVGLPVALVLAWTFEITPEGLKRTE